MDINDGLWMKRAVAACCDVLFHLTLILMNEIHEQCLAEYLGAWQKFESEGSLIRNTTPSLGLESCCCVRAITVLMWTHPQDI
jgi:hypothetical protein